MQTMTSDSGDDLPVGEIHRQSDGVPGWLAPTETPGLYDFHYGAIPADGTGTLSDGFAIAVLNCGGQCGGLQLVYNDTTSGQWLAYADSAVAGGYKVVTLFRSLMEGKTALTLWLQIKRWNGAGTTPAGGYGVWLWRESA
jgi:hypothetical protein